MKHDTIHHLLVIAGLACAVVALAAGCGDRDSYWDRPLGGAQALGLNDAVAVTDPNADRVVLLTTGADRTLRKQAVTVQRGMRTVQVSPDRSKVFVISEGDGDRRPPRGQTSQSPALELVTRDPAGRRRYPLSEPLTGLALDPHGQWAVLYADQSSGALVRNPNELLLVDLQRPADASAAAPNPRSHTLRSFGGQPQRFTFTDQLNLPGGPRRLLVVETEQDVAVVDLLHPELPEITIQLTAGTDARQLHPAGVTVSDGDPAAMDDTRIAIRMDNDSSVILAQLVPGDGRDFRPDLNLTDVGGVPSDAAFVRTDGGSLALAALVPSRSQAVLVDPSTGLTIDVALPAPYRRLSLVTADATSVSGAVTPAAPAVDVALLWDGGNGGGVSFWELGRTAGQPYRAVEAVGVSTAVNSVLSVAGDHPELKILGTTAATFFLLDLKTRTSAPFLTSVSGVQLTPSRLVGDRAWAYLQDRTDLSVVDLLGLHPARIHIDRPISAVFEILAVEGTPAAGARSLLVWHAQGSGGATVYDAAADGTAVDQRTNYSAILTEELDAQNP